VTRNVTWPNGEITELDTSFFRAACGGDNVDKDEWKVLRKQEMHFFFSQIVILSKVCEIYSHAVFVVTS